MPGGKVAFYTGILPICEDETGIAVVMGHEVAHAIASHARERMSQGLVANGLIGGLQVAMGENPSLTETIFLQAVGIGGQVGMLKFGRDQELEADQLGLIFMSIAYIVLGLIQYAQRLAELLNDDANNQNLIKKERNYWYAYLSLGILFILMESILCFVIIKKSFDVTKV